MLLRGLFRRLKSMPPRWRRVPHIGGFAVFGASSLCLLNVAYADEPPASPALAAPTESLDDLEKSKKKKKRRSTAKPLPNPGKFDDYQKECKEVLMTDVFAGARFEMNYIPVQRQEKQMGIVFVSHFDNNAPNGRLVEFGPQYYSENQVLIGRVDDQMRVMGRYHQNITPEVGLRSIIQSQNGGHDFHLMLDLDYKAKDSFTHGKFTAGPQGKIAALSYQQSFTQNSSLGSELMHQLGQLTHLSFAFRHKKETDQGKQAEITTLMVGTMPGLTASYTNQICPQVMLASEFSLGLTPDGAATTVHAGALYKYQTFKLQANVKSDLVMQMSLETKVMEGMTLSFCSEVNHLEGGSAWGLGLRLG